MKAKSSVLFSKEESAYRQMLADGGVLIGDRWFGGDASAIDRARYFVSYARRQERNRRRRERRKADGEKANCVADDVAIRSGCRERKVISDNPDEHVSNRLSLDCRKCPPRCRKRKTVSDNPDEHVSNRLLLERCKCPPRSQERKVISDNPDEGVANRLLLERRKCLRRSTLNECPTAADIRTAWHFRNASDAAYFRLGGMLLDLECYVDNSLITIVRNHRLKIVGRKGGLRAWIDENCPELALHYKTLQRIKSEAKLLRQQLNVMDPVPVSMLMNNDITSDEIKSLPVHVQPRGGDEAQPVKFRFPWEKSPRRFDADGRLYFENANYTAARFAISQKFLDHIEGFRAIFRAAIILNGKGKCTDENYSAAGAIVAEEFQAEEFANMANGNGEICIGAKTNGFCSEIMEMLRYVGKNPRFLAEVGLQLGKDVGTVAGELLLPERTMERIRDGEKMGIGRIALDIANAYVKFYSQFLVCRWGNGYNDQW